VDERGKNDAGRDRGGIQSLHRAFDILEFVARFDVVGATRIANELGLSVSTVNNLCRTMADRGYLIGRRGQYRIGPAFSLLATRWDPILALPEVVAPALEALTEATGQASVATVLTGMDARVVAFEQGRGPVGTPPPRADRRALELPTGTVLVALTRRAEWEAFISDCLAHSSGAVTREELHRELERVGATGVCGRRSAEPHGQTAIAVPVWTAGETVACAIGVSAPTYLVDAALADHIRSRLVATARELSAELGASSVPEIPGEIDWGRTH
jgi:Transcriptional regulator